METAEAPPIDPSPVEAAVAASHPDKPAAVEAKADKMFRYSAYLHVGPGAEECEHAKDGLCEDPGHFHAWCRLPNKFQHRDLYAKAAAAKARRLRLLEDPESDARTVVDQDLERLVGDAYIETIIDDLLKGEWAQDYVTAMTEVNEREGYEHVEQERERFKELGKIEMSKSAEEESEEFKELGKFIGGWTEAITAEMTRLQEPKREALREMSQDQLLEQLRKLRVAKISDQIYLHTYNQWEWFICTMKVTPHPTIGYPTERYWEEIGTLEQPSPGSMWGESPEVIDALQAVYDELERALGSGVSGNS